MKKIVFLLVLLLTVMVFSEKLYVFNGFSYITGQLNFQAGKALVEVPYGVRVNPESFSVNPVPENTLVTYTPIDDLQGLYERNLGKTVKFTFSDGTSEYLEILSSKPVFRNVRGELLFNPSGTPSFSGDFAATARFLVEAPSEYEGQFAYAYRIENNSWTAKYTLSIEDLTMTGLMVVNLQMDPEGREVILVSSNPSTGAGVRNMAKLETADYSSPSAYSDAEMRLYEVVVPLDKGTNQIAFLSKNMTGSKNYVFRANRYDSGFTGVDVDINLDAVPVDLPSGSIEIWKSDVYMGSAYIDNVAEGEALALQAVARSIEITGKKSSKLVRSDEKYRYYENTYTVRNLSEKTEEVMIEDYLGQNVEKSNFNIASPQDFKVNEGLWQTKVEVNAGETVEVVFEYRVRYSN